MNKKYFLIPIFALFSLLTYSQGPWNFNGSNDIWESTGTAANLTSGATFSTLDVNGAGNPMLRTSSANIDASSVTHAVITLKNNSANKQMRVFYQTTGTNRYVNVGISANDSDFVTYYVDMTGNSDWTGTVNDLTFQFRENSSFNSAVAGTIDIDNIEMTSSDLGVNMLNNPSFENWNDPTGTPPVDPVGFYKHESVERSSDSHSGDYSIKVTATSTRDIAQTVNDIIAGATYRVSVNYKLEANTGNGVRLWSTWKDESNGNLTSSDLQPSSYLNTVSTNWATFTVDAVAPENASKMNFEVRAYNGATVYWDSFSVSKIQEPSNDPCDGVTGAPAIADDFDGNSVDILEYAGDNNATYAIVDGTPFGSSSNVLQYVDDGGQYANIQIRTCNKFDMSVTNFFTMDVYIDGSSLTGAQTNKVQFKLQDKSMGGNAWQTQVVSEVLIDAVDTWQTVEFDFAAASDRTDIDQVVIQFNGENNNDLVTAYIDNLTSSTSPEPDPCADAVGAPMIADDFDGGQTDIKTYTDDALTTAVVDGTSIGGNGNVLQYVDDGVGYYANVQLRTCNKFDMSLSNYFTLDVYLDSSTITGTSPNQVQFKLQNGDLGAPWETQVVATATVDQLDTWQTLVFDFNLIAGALDRTDIDNVVIQVNGEANNDPVTAYIDNITSTAGAPATNYNVTFEVDANNILVGDRGMYLGGGMFGGSDTHAMSDDDGDGVWSVTLELPSGTEGAYAFLNSPFDGGDWGTKENITGLACAYGQYNDRYFGPITEDTTISFCFATCETSCTTPVNRYDVTFEVGTANETVNSGVFLGGGVFNGAKTFELFDADGDGIYARTLSIPEGTAGGFKFAIDPENHWSYSTSEDFAGDCTEGQYNDRPLAPVTEATTYSYCFGSCEAASTCALDTTAPVIALVGDNPQEINNGDAYTELGATATDDVDGDISTNIVIDSSAVDTSVDGSYTVTYDVSDAAGNAAAQVTRTVNVSTPGYCDSTPSSNDNIGITSVSFNGTDFTSGGDITYEDFTATAVAAGQSTTASLSITFETGYTYDTHVWIDLNDDFTFDSTELLYSGTSANNIPTTLDASFVVPVDAPLGDHRVRIGTADTGQATPNPCYTGSYGVTIDMTITVTEPPSCLAPTALTVSAVAATTVDVAWSSDGSNFNIEYGPSGFTQGTGTTDTSAVASYSLTGLSANTSYDLYVQTDCSADGSETSDWAGPITFVTECDAISTFPYTENFDTDWSCWTVVNADSDSYTWSQSSTYITPRSGSFTAHGMGSNDDYLISPQFTLTGNERLVWYDIVESSTYNNTYDVLISTTGKNIADFTTNLGTYDCTNTSWEEHIIDLSMYTGNVYIALHQTYSAITYYGFGVDDFSVEEIPSCLSPTDVTATNITSSSADISWVSDGTSFNIEYGPEGFTPGSGTTDTTTTTSYSLSGLSSNTTYDVYVQNDCGSNGTSEMVLVTLTSSPACGDTVTYCYDNGLNSVFSATVDNVGDYITVSIIEGDTESCCDDLIIYDTSDDSGNVLYSGAGDLTGVSVTSTTGIISVWVDADGSISCLNPSSWSGLPSTSLVMDITCTPPPSCEDPSDLTVSDITTTTASVSWTANNSETAWEYQVVESGLSPAETGLATSDNPLLLTGLVDNTAYDVYLRANCGADGTSEWVMVSFTTEPAPIVPDYINDFTTFPGDLWTLDQGFVSSWLEDGFANNGTTGAAKSNIYSSGNNNIMYSPVFDLSGGQYFLNLKAAVATWNSSTTGSSMGSDDSVTVSISTDGGTTWTALHVWDVNNTPPIEGVDMPEVDLSSYSSNSARFAIIMNDGAVNDPEDYDFFIDDFQITTDSLGVDDNSISLFNYFPNPVNDVLTIKAQSSVEDVKVFNMLGQMVLHQNPNSRDCTVDLSAMQTGAYFVQVSIGNNVEMVRVLKK